MKKYSVSCNCWVAYPRDVHLLELGKDRACVRIEIPMNSDRSEVGTINIENFHTPLRFFRFNMDLDRMTLWSYDIPATCLIPEGMGREIRTGKILYGGRHGCIQSCVIGTTCQVSDKHKVVYLLR